MKKILAIDDQKDNLTTIKAVLKSNLSNCEVITALSGKLGIELAENEQPDVILLDIIMPQMDGYEVCKRLKADELTKHIPIIMITAIKTDADSRIKGLELGADAFLSKPIDAVELSAQIKVMLRIKEAEDKLRKEKEILKEDVSDAIDKLKKSEKKYRLLAENSSDVIWQMDLKLRFTYVSPSVKSMMGYTKEEWLGTYLYQHAHRSEFVKMARHALGAIKNYKKIRIASFESKMLTKSGDELPVEIIGKLLFNDKGFPIGLQGNTRDISERKKAEQLLRASESHLSSVMKAAKDVAFITTDLEGKDSKILSFSKGAENIFGYKADEVIGKKVEILHSEKDVDSFKSMQKKLRSGESDTTELILIRKSGEHFPAIFSHHALYNDKGDLNATLGVTIDITDRKKTEQALIESKELFSLFMKYSPVHTFIKEVNSTESRVLQASENFKNMIGVKGEEMIGKTMEELFPIEFAKKITADDMAVIENGKVLKLDENLDGKNYTTIKFPINMGDKKLLAGFSIDITDRVQAEETLQKRERIYSTLINNLPGFTYRCQNDKDWTMDFISIGCEDITGYSPDDFMRKKITFNDIIDDKYDKKIRGLWEDAIDGKSVFEYEYQIITKNLEVKWVWERGCGVYSDSGKVLYLEGFITDITERKRAEQVQKVIYNISNAVVTSISLKDFIGLIKIELGTLLDTTNFYIAFYDEDTNMFSSPYVSDEKDGFDTWPAEKSFSAYVLKSKKSLLVTKTEMLKMHANGLVDIVGTPSEVWMGVPLFTDGVVNGIFAVQSYTDENAYTKSDLEILEIIADQISISIDRKQSDLKIKESEELLQLAVEVSGLGHFEWKSEFEYYHWSNQMYNIFELDNNSDVDPHANFLSILHPEDKEIIIKKFEQSLDTNNVETRFKNEYRIICDERIKYISAHATHFKDKNGKVIRIIGTCQDITDLKLAEQKIIESEERFTLSMKASKDGLFDWNLITDEIYYSENWKSMLGYTDDELPNLLSVWQELTHPEGRVKSLEKMDWAIKNKVERYEEEFKMKHKLGHWVDILSRPEFVYDEEGNAIRVVGTHVDISKQREYEQNLKNALLKAKESDRLKSTFLATMSHELRTPLNAIIGFSDIINEDLPMHDIVSFNETINKSGNHLLHIVEDLFDITLIESGQIKISKENISLLILLNDINEIIEVEQQNSFKENLNLRLLIPKDAPDIMLHTDPAKFKQILLNLLKNALKFTHEGSIQYGYSIEKKDNLLKFFVKDTGIGISLDKQEYIFDMFRRVDDSNTKVYGGTGIGLSISKKLTELLGGQIWLESEEGEGTVFYFTIPFEAPKNIVEEPRENVFLSPKKIEDSKVNRKKLVLIVEDVSESFEFLRVVLESKGLNTIWAENGKIAVDLCRSNPDIDIVLMDINMPIMNGFEATKLIKDNRPNLPIIAQTAYAIVGDRQKSIDAGCDDYISKPIKQDVLMKIVEKFLY